MVNPFPPNKNPNPHLISYVSSATSRVLGSGNSQVARFVDCDSHLRQSDAVLVFGSIAYSTREVISLSKACRQMKLPLCFWSTDDPYEIDLHLDVANCFDWIWTNDRASLPFYDMDNVSQLPLAADPGTHCLPFPKESDYLYDVSFVGVEFPNRREILKAIQPLLEALDSIVIGPNWTLDTRFIRRTKISNREAAHVANLSRVVLNMGRTTHLANTRCITPSTPGPRTFEVGGCSTVQLVSWDQPEIEEYYVQGEEFIFCDGVTDFEREIQDLVHDRDKRRKLAEASFGRTKSCHMYDHRVKEIVDRIGKLLH